MWDKVGAIHDQKDLGTLAVPIPQTPGTRREKWRWRNKEEEPACGYSAGCTQKPKCDLERGDASVLCVGCASASGVVKLLEMGERCRRSVRGVALPLGAEEYEDLDRLKRSALVICCEPEGSEAHVDAAALRESLESLKWATTMAVDKSKGELEHVVSEFCETMPKDGAFLFAYIGRGLRLGDGTALMVPTGVSLPETR